MLRIIADAFFMSEDIRDLVGSIVRIPCQATIETQPGGIRISRRQRPVAVDTDHPQAMIASRSLAGGIEPGERAAGSSLGERSIIDQNGFDAEPCKMDGRRDTENAAVDNNDLRDLM